MKVSSNSWNGTLTYFAPRRVTFASFVSGACSGNDHGAGNAALPGAPGESLSHVARADRPDPVRQVLRGKLGHRVVRAPDLERADGLEVFELEIDLGRQVVGAQPDQRRADDRSGNPVPGRLDLLQRDRVMRFHVASLPSSWSGRSLPPDALSTHPPSVTPAEAGTRAGTVPALTPVAMQT